MILNEEEYMDFADVYAGFCPNCGAFTRGNTEPDARGYDCPDCGGNRVMGAEEALMEGFITIDV